ncbi:MAG: phosphoglucosamine mutase [Armatimonadetes bacterium]|nr:phosphoglucosamine mutase [Armatimonadota bacterium]MDW8029475.1 phosphoglucosamine mutase [Armatimonadota bacterium]
MSKPIVSVSGIRGVIGETLLPEEALRWSLAYGTMVDGGTVVLGRDTRLSGEMLRGAVLAGLLSTGCKVIDLGIVPTPTLQLAVQHWQADGAVCITASHNPAEWNALKFFDSSGMYLDAEGLRKLKGIYEAGEFKRARWKEVGQIQHDGTAIDRHIERILTCVDVERIRSKKFKVVIDCVNGAACFISPRLLERLGCEVIALFEKPTGIFQRNPEPIAENLTELCRVVKENGADVGFAHDADVDRLAIVADGGEALGEEMTLVIAVYHVLAHKERGAVVTNLSTTMAVDEVAKHFGVEVYRTPVGDINVSKRLKEVGGAIGGEGNGGVIYPKIQYARDAIAALALVLEFMAMHNEPLSELVKRMPRYHMAKKRLAISKTPTPELFERIKQRYTAEEIIEEDGVKLKWDDHWVHVRPSGTEPILRVIAEAKTLEQAEKLCDEVINDMKRLLEL